MEDLHLQVAFSTLAPLGSKRLPPDLSELEREHAGFATLAIGSGKHTDRGATGRSKQDYRNGR
jgi:hypothetical protein